MASTAVEKRMELAKFCSSKDWSKAIRVLDSLLTQSPSSIQDICNRAFCYSQLELYKHVVKDCDRALQLDPTLIQACILKGRAFSALGRKEEAVLIWEQGFEHALRQSADLKQLLELEELLSSAKQGNSVASSVVAETPGSSHNATETVPPVSATVSTKTSATSEMCKMSNGELVSLRKSADDIKTSENAHETNDTSAGPLVSAKVSTKTSENSENFKMCKDELVSLRKSEDLKQKSCETNDRSTMPVVSAKISTKTSEPSEKYKMSNGELVSLRKSEDQSQNSHETNDRCIDSKDRSPKNKKHHSRPNGILEKQQNGMVTIEVSKGDSKSKGSSQFSLKVSTCDGESSCSADIRTQLGLTNGKHDERSDASTKSKKVRISRISKTKSINVDFRLSRGIARVNEGNYAQAISIFDQILKEEPAYSEALIGRGTAYAFRRELDSAISDFTNAIQANPAAGEAWKRRGQAKAALGESSAAISDLTKALEYEPDSADVLHERGIVNFKFKDFAAAAEDLSACLKTEKSNKSAYTYLGLALSSLGEYAKAEEAHKKAIHLDQSFLEAWAHLAQLHQELSNWEKAFECLEQILKIDRRYPKAYHLRGLLYHAMGEHKKAIKELSVGLSVESSNVECLYLRASCYHAVGDYREAVKDYDAALDLELDSMEKFVLQCMAFYQKEIALYTASKLNSEFCWFDIDGDIDPLFKEYWCKRLHPKNVCEKVYRQPTLRESLRKAKARKQEFSITKQKTILLQAADSIGKKIQYYCPGFLPNKRQHRMAGLAAIEIAQKVSKAWRSLQMELKQSSKGAPKSGRKVRRREKLMHSSQNRGGAGCSTSSMFEMSTPYGGSSEEKSSMRSIMSWHDVYNLAVKWRQISEPCDPVVWVNKLSVEEFSAGFGAHTPLVLGQIKVARYFPYFPRVMNAAKMVIKERKYVYDKKDNLILLSDDQKLREISNADSCSDLYRAVGEDFWLSTWCNSSAVEGKNLEGTRITLMKKEEKGFDFAIRTPCTPARWEDFDMEMMAAWEALCDLYCGDTFGSTDFEALENVRDAILRITYYWYNFMPLSRGSAVVGFVVLLGLLLAANMEFSGSIPKGTQVDWEAILNVDPQPFSESVKSWLYPALKTSTAWKAYPDVATTFETTGSVVNALSTFSD